MRKLILCLACMAILFTSCEKPLDNYNGDIVIEKKRLPYNHKVKLQHKTKDCSWGVIEVFVVEHDYDRFNVGDTIR